MPLFVLRRLTELWEALIAFGHLWVHIPVPPPADPTGPAPGHPERLRPDVPPTDRERALWNDLTGGIR
ncbi:DUF6059 family protein [Streptomyces sp. NPDC055632]